MSQRCRSCLIGLGSNLQTESLNSVDIITSSIYALNRYGFCVSKIGSSNPFIPQVDKSTGRSTEKVEERKLVEEVEGRRSKSERERKGKDVHV